jgi:heme-degrading monooxygenase HmoA
MHARMSTLELDPARVDEAVSQFEEQDLPSFRDMDGFKGFTMFVDRSSGKVIGTAYWASEEAMAASEEPVKEVRERFADTGGARGTPQVERFEVALDTFVG